MLRSRVNEELEELEQGIQSKLVVESPQTTQQESQGMMLSERTSKRPLVPVSYWGGKARHLELIIGNLKRNTRYIESHCGSLVVGINQNQYEHETANDRDGLVFDFFKVMKDPTLREEFLEKAFFTMYSKREFDDALDRLENSPNDDPVSNALIFYILCNQSFGGAQKSWQRTPYVVRNAMPQSVSRWLGRFPDLQYIALRLKMVQLECMDGTELIQKYGKKNTTIYCDPTYHRSCRVAKNVYRYEMSDEEHIRFLETVCKSPSDIAISGYENEVYDEYLCDWFKVYDRVKRLSGFGSERQEVLWLSYSPEEVK